MKHTMRFTYLTGSTAKPFSRGFTLVELLVVVAILGILIGLATPSMAKFVADWRVNSAINSFSQDFRLARAEAIKRSRPVVICRAKPGATTPTCDTGTEWDKAGWLVFVDNNFNGNLNLTASGTSPPDELLVQQNKLPGIQSFTASGVGVKYTVLPNGLVKRAAVNSKTFTVQSALGGSSPMTEKIVCVSATGRVRKGEKGTNCG